MDPTTRDFQPGRGQALQNAGNNVQSTIQTFNSSRQDPEPIRPVRSPTTSTLPTGTGPHSPLPGFPHLHHASTWGTRPSTQSSRSDNTFRRRRGNTIRAYHAPVRPGWEPGAEPGIDTKEGDEDEKDLYESLHTHCDITVVDFSDERMEQYDLDNGSIGDFLDNGRPDWVSTRWICVNGISYDVIKILSNNKGFHRLAVEDMINPRNRTKADWYPDHCYMVLPLAKLVHLRTPGPDHHHDDSSSESSDVESDDGFYKPRSKKRSWFSRVMYGSSGDKAHPPPELPSEAPTVSSRSENYSSTIAAAAGISTGPAQSKSNTTDSFRTLQRFKAGANRARTDFMESRSALASHGLAVSVEQVSIFLTADDTVVSFFEHSARDILKPLLPRLESDKTILRRSGEASMLTQSLIDAIIDLAIPVAAAYDDAIGELEFDVLTDPDMRQPKKLYVLSSELALLKNIIHPILSLVNALRDHSNSTPSAVPASLSPAATPGLTGRSASPFRPRPRRNPTYAAVSSVEISQLTRTYLADVEDHIVVLTTALDQMASTAADLTSLIFNMMGAYQNESMKQLTLVTIFFLPLTFLTGYFGQNFNVMWSVQQHSDAFFWWVAVPVQVFVSLYLLRGTIVRVFQRGKIYRWVHRREKRIQRREELMAVKGAERKRRNLEGIYRRTGTAALGKGGLGGGGGR